VNSPGLSISLDLGAIRPSVTDKSTHSKRICAEFSVNRSTLLLIISSS